MCLPEKGRHRTASDAEQSVLRSPVCQRKIAKIRAFLAYFGLGRSDFLCSADCVAEREGFEPSVQVLARTTV
jgi:hypothetical protein